MATYLLANITIRLRDTAADYAISNQVVPELRFGDCARLANPPKSAGDLAAIRDKRVVPLYVVAEDARDIGVDPANFTHGIEALQRSRLPSFVAGFGRVFHW